MLLSKLLLTTAAIRMMPYMALLSSTPDNSALIGAGAGLAVPRASGRVHRAFCLVRRDLLPHLDAFLAAGERRLARWHESLGAVEVDFDDEAAAFDNLNSLADLAATAGAPEQAA